MLPSAANTTVLSSMSDVVEGTVDDKAGMVNARIFASVAVAAVDAAARPFNDEAAAAACADFDAVDLSILVLKDIFAINGERMDA